MADTSSHEYEGHDPGAEYNYNGETSIHGAGPVEPVAEPAEPQPSGMTDESRAQVDGVLQSDIGVNTLLTRLKQSVASARDFAAFLKKRSTLEDEHAQGIKKLCRSTHEAIRRPEHRQGTYAHSYEEVSRIHERMADHGLQFALNLHQMSEDLQELASNMERGRKHWKQSGLNAEKRVQDSEALMDKAKSKYDSLAEDYDRARTGDRQSGKKFGLKGPKSAAQHEEDLHRKVQAADTDYASRVEAAHSQRQELVNALRPQAIRALQDLIMECDAGVSLQLAKLASLNEKLLLGQGLCVSPLKSPLNGTAPENKSLREIARQIDNEKDFRDYVLSFSNRTGNRSSEIKYERHPALNNQQQQSASPTTNRQSFGMQGGLQNPTQLPPLNLTSSEQGPQVTSPTSAQQQPTPSTATTERGGYLPNIPPSLQHPATTDHQGTLPLSLQQTANSERGGVPPSLQQPLPPAPGQSFGPPLPQSGAPAQHTSSPQSHANAPQVGSLNHHRQDLPPLNPVFGVSLEELFRRDGSAVPMIIYQCVQAVDLFGLEVEGIYRLSGTSTHVMQMKSMFDNDSSQVDFRNPESFFHDVNSVAGLLKQFFRDLPDPLLTAEHYGEFINAAKIEDDTIRRDSLHAVINSLPDPNYATLRALTLHLNRVQEHSQVNRMNAGNLAICFGPTLMGPNTGPNIQDAGWQVRVIDTILQNTYQIFDDD